MLRRIIVALLGMATLTAAQPVISQPVGDSASFSAPITPGGWASIFGSGLASETSLAPSLPLPTNLNGTQVELCPFLQPNAPCVFQGIDYASPDQINFLVNPPSLPQNPTGVIEITVTVIVNGMSVTVGAELAQYAPTIFGEGWDCWFDPSFGDTSPCILTWTHPNWAASPFGEPFRGAITDTNDKLVTSQNPAHLNRYYSIWMTGFGVIPNTPNFAVKNTLLQMSVPLVGYAFVPNEGYVADWFPLEPTYVGVMAYPGLYQVNFKLDDSILGVNDSPYSARWPCGTYKKWDLPLIGDYQNGDTVNFPFDHDFYSANPFPVSIPIIIQDQDRTDCQG